MHAPVYSARDRYRLRPGFILQIPDCRLDARDQLHRPTTFSDATVEMEHEIEEGTDR